VIAIAAALSLALSAMTLDVPYVPQTRWLCGGASAVMVFRFWGDRHAGTKAFEPLVNRRAGGIVTDRLVETVRQLDWTATPFVGSLELLRHQLIAGHPIVLLLRDRPGLFHYVVAIGADAGGIWIHDPEWGPSRRLTNKALERVWGASHFWSLLILPADGHSTPDAALQPHLTGALPGGSDVPYVSSDRCRRLLDAAIAEIQSRGLDNADEPLGRVRTACPRNAPAFAELAGVRFAQGRWREAASLASDAVGLDRTNPYAWDVLGSSRFVLDDLPGALAAWNEIGKPRIDSIDIIGLTRARYALIAQTLALEPNAILTKAQLRLAARRLEQLPDQSAVRIGYRPDEDGFARVDVAIAERSAPLRNTTSFIPLAFDVLANRQISVSVPGSGGQGELWTANWRFWENRPRLAFEWAAPRFSPAPGVWRVDGSWEAQTYSIARGSIVRQEQLHGSVGVTNWLAPNWRYQVDVGMDSWDRSRRAASVAGTLEHRAFSDRLTVTASAAHWFALEDGRPFSRGTLSTTLRSSQGAHRIFAVADAGLEEVTLDAPLSLWSGAGSGQARAPLLRAHPLLDNGVINGVALGRQLLYANAELQHWLDATRSARVGVAGFVDAARAAFGLAPSTPPLQVDAGVGLRLRVPGSASTLRLDYARGLRDGANAVTLGWSR
jgi:hypothetical protein